MAQLSNKERMSAAVRGWIAGAQVVPNGAELLQDKASWISGEIGVMNFRLSEGKAVRSDFEGLTVFDLTDAREALSAAAIKLLERRLDESLSALASSIADAGVNIALRAAA